MSVSFRTMRCVQALAVLLFAGWTPPASADTFTATWNFHLQGGDIPDPNPTPFYDCPFMGESLICDWLWDQGLELSSATPLPLYGDSGAFYDAFGSGLPLASEISHGTEFGFGDGLLQVVPACRPGLQPCFAAFTPTSMSTNGFFSSGEGGVFFTSSRGGLVVAPDGQATFSGPEWTDIAWMYVGLYRPDECADSDADCLRGEQMLDIHSLTFEAEAIPEPASVLLVGSGLLAIVRRYRRRT